MSSLLSASIVAVLVSAVCGAGFEYPTSAFGPLDPSTMQNIIIGTGNPFIEEYETPIQVRMTSAICETYWQCLAVYHPTALDVLTKKRPAVVADDETIANYGTTETRMMCGAYASLMVSNSLFPEATGDHAALIDSLGLNSSFLTMNKDVADCDIDDTVCLQDVATLHGFYPEIMASIVAKQMLHFLANDGWNADGSVGVDGEECTANCMPYGDTTGYAPRRRRHRRWKPLSEDNGKGFSYDYAHITPHIGRTAVTKTIARTELESRDADHPHYDYDAEVALVIERLADLATNDTAKMLVEFFDNKALVFVAILNAAEPLVGWSWEERQLFLVGYYAGEYDAVVQAWLEKVRWDRVRPTTLIKANGDERIITFGGPFRGVQTIKSRDFEAYKRVMPHSEYPSGSACICHTAAQFTRKFLTERHGITEALAVQIPNPHYRGGFAAGSSKLEPGLTPAQDLFITMESLEQLSAICGESRLWGGMHFTASVPAGRALCDGLRGYEYATELLDGQPL